MKKFLALALSFALTLPLARPAAAIPVMLLLSVWFL